MLREFLAGARTSPERCAQLCDVAGPRHTGWKAGEIRDANVVGGRLVHELVGTSKRIRRSGCWFDERYIGISRGNPNAGNKSAFRKVVTSEICHTDTSIVST